MVQCSECKTSQFCSVPWVLYTLSSVVVRSQPKGIKTKMTVLLLISGVNWQGVLKQKRWKMSYLYIQNININLTTFLFLLENFYTEHKCCSVAAGCVLVLGITDLSIPYKIELFHLSQWKGWEKILQLWAENSNSLDCVFHPLGMISGGWDWVRGTRTVSRVPVYHFEFWYGKLFQYDSDIIN
jgi:hypothetical protein